MPLAETSDIQNHRIFQRMTRIRRTRRRGRRNRRNKSAKQRGGQFPAKSIQDWFRALEATQLLGNPDAQLKHVDLAIPEFTENTTADEYRVRLQSGLIDYRQLAADLAISPFLHTMEGFITLAEEENEDSRILLTQYENDLRAEANGVLTMPPVATPLTSPANRPLLIQILAANYEGSPGAARPILTSEPTPSETAE